MYEEVLCESKRACDRSNQLWKKENVASHKESGKIIQETKIMSHKTFAEEPNEIL